MFVISVTLELPSSQPQKKKREPDISLYDFFPLEIFRTK